MRLIIPSLILLLLTSCGQKQSERAGNVFHYNEMNGITSLDPASSGSFENNWGVNQIFNGLVQMDEKLSIRPAIARNFTISPDGQTYTFFLRTDVRFHDDPCFPGGKGRKVAAMDAVFSFRRLADPAVSNAVSLLQKVEKGGIVALNDSVLQIKLSEPFSPFLNILTMQYFAIVPREAIEKYRVGFRTHPVGTGPFRFHTWEEGGKLILLRNDDYFEQDSAGNKLPYLDAVSVSFLRDRETAFMQLLNGRLDMLSGADAFNVNEVLDRSGDLHEAYRERFFLQKGTFLKTDYLGILVDSANPLLKNSPLLSREFRLALNMAFDRKKLLKHLRNGIGVPAVSGFIPKGMKAWNGESAFSYRYDPVEVARLLAAAGYPGGKGLPVLKIYISDGYKEQVEFIQSQLARQGIRVEISIEKAPVLRQAVNRGEFPVFKKSWVADYADEENFMSLFYSKNFAPDGPNFFHFRHPLFDRLYEEAVRETDPERKTSLYRRMDSVVVAEAPVIPLYFDEAVRIVSRRISGLTLDPMNSLQLKTVRKRS